MDNTILRVDLADRSYDIVFAAIGSETARAALLPFLGSRRFLTVTDSNVQRQYGEAVAGWLAELHSDFSEYQFPAGESSKTPETALDLCRFAALLKLDRQALMVAVGGGVTGDLTGFAAAIYLRGIDFIQIPTTLLAMVDSSVGGKTGVDIPEGKNLVGAFHQPKLVLIDVGFLSTLPEREWRGGLAEVIKYGMIFDAGFLALLEDNIAKIQVRDPEFCRRMIYDCCAFKARVVAADERESGERALLNYGHTFGHALEKLSHFAISHGEGVAVGMNLAAELAVELGRIPAEIARRQREWLEKIGLPTLVPAEFTPEALWEAMKNDKKSSAGRINFVLPAACGRAEVVRDCPPETVKRVIARVTAS